MNTRHKKPSRARILGVVVAIAVAGGCADDADTPEQSFGEMSEEPSGLIENHTGDIALALWGQPSEDTGSEPEIAAQLSAASTRGVAVDGPGLATRCTSRTLTVTNRYYQQLDQRPAGTFCVGDIWIIEPVEPPDPVAPNDFIVNNLTQHSLWSWEVFNPSVIERERRAGTPIAWPEVEQQRIYHATGDNTGRLVGPPFVDERGCILHTWILLDRYDREVDRREPGSVCLADEPYEWIITDDMIQPPPTSTSVPEPGSGTSSNP